MSDDAAAREGEDPAAGDGADGGGAGEGTGGDGAAAAEKQATGESTDDRPPVPESAEAAVADDDHALPLEDLVYPTLELPDGSVGDDGSVEGTADLDREEMGEWLEDLAGGLTSHDVAVAAPDGRVTFGVAPQGVDVSFDPGEDGVGDLEVTFRLSAKPMTVQDPDDPAVGARGGRGFIPLAMLTEDADPSSYRCYNWVEDPTRD